MGKYPSPLVKKVPDKNADAALQHAQQMINFQWIRMAESGHKEYRLQVAQDIAWHLRSEEPLPEELKSFLLQKLDLLAEGVEPNEVFPTSTKENRPDRLKRIELWSKVKKLRDEGVKLKDAITEVAGNTNKMEPDECERRLEKVKKAYEREQKAFMEARLGEVRTMNENLKDLSPISKS